MSNKDEHDLEAEGVKSPEKLTFSEKLVRALVALGCLAAAVGVASALHRSVNVLQEAQRDQVAYENQEFVDTLRVVEIKAKRDGGTIAGFSFYEGSTSFEELPTYPADYEVTYSFYAHFGEIGTLNRSFNLTRTQYDALVPGTAYSVSIEDSEVSKIEEFRGTFTPTVFYE